MEKLGHQFDAITGIETVTGVDPLTGRFIIKHRADLTQNIEHAKAATLDEDRWRAGVKKGMAYAGHIPAMTVIELKQIGVDVYTAPLKEIRAGLEKLGKPGFIWKS